MNIKRIIREELEGFKDSSQEDWDWSNDNTDYGLRKSIIEFNPPLDYKTELDKIDKVFKSLHENGLKWAGNASLLEYKGVIMKTNSYISLTHLSISDYLNISYAANDSHSTLEERREMIVGVSPRYKFIDGRDLFDL